MITPASSHMFMHARMLKKPGEKEKRTPGLAVLQPLPCAHQRCSEASRTSSPTTANLQALVPLARCVITLVIVWNSVSHTRLGRGHRLAAGHVRPHSAAQAAFRGSRRIKGVGGWWCGGVVWGGVSGWKGGEGEGREGN